MTGPVERVPPTAEQRLSDVTLDYWAAAAETAPPGELGMVNFPAVAQMLIAELRAARAELRVLRPSLRRAKGRIDKALARIDKAEPRQWRRVAVMEDIRAALTGPVETPRSGPEVTHLAVIQASLPPGLTEVAGGSQEHCQSALEEWVRASGLRDGERALIVAVVAETIAEPGVGVYTARTGPA